MIGIIEQISSDLKLTSPLKALYHSLVWPQLEYGSVLGDPGTQLPTLLPMKQSNNVFYPMLIM